MKHPFQEISSRKTNNHCTVCESQDVFAVTPLKSKNNAASEGADTGQTSGDETKDTQDTREPADPAAVDEQSELEGTDDSLEFKTPASNVTQKHF